MIDCLFLRERSQDALGANGSASFDRLQNALGAGGSNLRGRSVTTLGVDRSALIDRYWLYWIDCDRCNWV
jgi:hypothetical protein